MRTYQSLNKKSVKNTFTPPTNVLESRPFAVQRQPKEKARSPQNQESQISDFAILNPNAGQLPVQAKLAIGTPGDKYEQEADRTAKQVVERINASPSRQQQQQNLQRQQMPENEDQVTLKPKLMIQRETIPDDETELQMKPMLQLQVGEDSTVGSPELESSIKRLQGSGNPLSAQIREQMEHAFGGVDFSGVKVHTDAQSDQLNRSIQAKAFTTGQDIFFRQGTYEPENKGGQELIAHELTHVLQQKHSAKVHGKFIQRVSDTGLAQDKLSASFVGKAQVIFHNWDNLNINQRLIHVTNAVNEELEKIGVPRITGLLSPLATIGLGGSENASFVRGLWQIWFDDKAFADGQNDDELARLANTVYHESRHAEQTYRVARLMAQKGQGVDQISASLGIGNNIAQLAFNNPLPQPNTKKGTFENKKKWKNKVAEWQEAEAWEMNMSKGTGNEAPSDIVNNLMTDAMATYEDIRDRYWQMKNNPGHPKVAQLSEEEKTTIEEDYIKAREYAKQAYLQYAKMPVEEDAWSVGGKIETLLGKEANTPEKQLENLAEDVRKMLPIDSSELEASI